MPELENNVPFPPLRKLYAKPTRYGLVEMEIGQSFLIPCEHEDSQLIRSRLTANISYLRKKHPERRFTVGKVEGGVRCWRIE